jgi:hypothetical protein
VRRARPAGWHVGLRPVPPAGLASGAKTPHLSAGACLQPTHPSLSSRPPRYRRIRADPIKCSAWRGRCCSTRPSEFVWLTDPSVALVVQGWTGGAPLADQCDRTAPKRHSHHTLGGFEMDAGATSSGFPGTARPVGPWNHYDFGCQKLQSGPLSAGNYKEGGTWLGRYNHTRQSSRREPGSRQNAAPQARSLET